MFAVVPLSALFVPALVVAGRPGFGVAHTSPRYAVFIAFVGLFFLMYTVGRSALGGVVGVWVRENTSWDADLRGWI